MIEVFMKKLLILSWMFCILTASTYATANDFCLAKKELLPYSPYSMFSVDCDGVKIKETSLLGRGLDERFEKKLKDNHFNILIRTNDHLLISKSSKEDLAVSEICLIKKSFDMDRSFVECDSGYSLTLNSSKDFEVTKFAEIYHYNILKQAKGRNGFYIISR